MKNREFLERTGGSGLHAGFNRDFSRTEAETRRDFSHYERVSVFLASSQLSYGEIMIRLI